MTAEVETEGAEAEAPAKGGKKRLFIIIGAAVIAVLLIGGGLYFVLGVGKAKDAASAAGGAGATAAAESFIFNLPELIVNLNTGNQAPAFMKVTIALEVSDQAMMTQIQPRMAKVVDAFQVYMRELRPSDLQGSAGLYRLKEELLRRVNVAVAPAQVQGILFKEILVQ